MTTFSSLNTEQQTFVDQAIQRGMAEIQRLIADGRVPPHVTTFSGLHDYVDANDIGGLCNDELVERIFPRVGDEVPDEFDLAVTRVQRALGQWMTMSMARTTLLVQSLADEALNAACAAVQKRLGIEHGDTAGQFFSDAQRDVVMGVFARYILAEIALAPSTDSAKSLDCDRVGR